MRTSEIRAEYKRLKKKLFKSKSKKQENQLYLRLERLQKKCPHKNKYGWCHEFNGYWVDECLDCGSEKYS